MKQLLSSNNIDTPALMLRKETQQIKHNGNYSIANKVYLYLFENFQINFFINSYTGVKL